MCKKPQPVHNHLLCSERKKTQKRKTKKDLQTKTYALHFTVRNIIRHKIIPNNRTKEKRNNISNMLAKRALLVNQDVRLILMQENHSKFGLLLLFYVWIFTTSQFKKVVAEY